MKQELNEVEINGVKYVRKDLSEPAVEYNGMPYVIIRTYSAGVHAGYLKSRTGKEVELIKSRRIWYWDGAASLSQMAVSGVTNPGNCKFTMEVQKIILTEAIEIIPCTESARINIQEVPVWKK